MSTVWTRTRPTLPPPLSRLGVDIAAFRKERGTSYRRIEPAASDVVMILGIGTPWQVAAPSRALETHQAFAVGLAMRPLKTVSDDPTACIEVRLPPWLARDLFQAMPCEADGIGSVTGLLGRGSDQLVETVANTSDPRAAALDVARLLAARLTDRAPRIKPEVRWAWRRIAQTNGQLSIRELAQEIGWSQRHFAARFRDHVGLAPKAAARLARFSAAYRHATGRAESLAQVAMGAGYSDQSHMCREFKELAGAAPNVIRRAVGSDVAINDRPPAI